MSNYLNLKKIVIKIVKYKIIILVIIRIQNMFNKIIKLKNNCIYYKKLYKFKI